MLCNQINRCTANFLSSRLSNPHFQPEVQAEAALINFTVTEAGLEEQLLAMTVQKERPDLALQKSALIKQQNAFKIKIKELEDGMEVVNAAKCFSSECICYLSFYRHLEATR